jgi:hypothetical protein
MNGEWDLIPVSEAKRRIDMGVMVERRRIG